MHWACQKGMNDMKTKQITLRLSEDVYSRLSASAEKMGITKGNYITYALKSLFNQEDVLEKMPDMMTVLNDINQKLDKERIEQ